MELADYQAALPAPVTVLFYFVLFWKVDSQHLTNVYIMC